MATAWEVDTAVYAEKSKLVSDEETSLLGLTFSSDGSKMYIVGKDNDTVYQYTLSPAWDVSTAVYAEKSKLVSTQDTSPQNVTFSSDGSKMYIAGFTNNTVYQYTLSTPWDVSIAVYADKLKDVSARETYLRDVTFSSNGTKMYIVGSEKNTVYQYTLSTPWGVDTATYANKYKLVSDEDGFPYGVTFKPDGSKMYIAGAATNRVYQYTLSTPWDVDTASYAEKSKDVSTQDTSPYGVTFKPDGSKMYIAGAATNTVYQYTLLVVTVTTQTPTGINRVNPTVVTANALIEVDVEGMNIPTRGFKYGLTSTGDTDLSESDSYSEGIFSLTLGGLTADTTYYIRAYATSTGEWGTEYGSYLEFKTAYPYGSFKTEIKAEATASSDDIAAVGGKRSLTINNHLIQTQTLADLIANGYLSDYKDQKTKLVVERPTPAPYEIGDTIERISAKLPYYPAASALISYAAAADAVHYYNLAGRDMIIRKLNVSFSAGNYVSVLELED